MAASVFLLGNLMDKPVHRVAKLDRPAQIQALYLSHRGDVIRKQLVGSLGKYLKGSWYIALQHFCILSSVLLLHMECVIWSRLLWHVFPAHHPSTLGCDPGSLQLRMIPASPRTSFPSEQGMGNLHSCQCCNIVSTRTTLDWEDFLSLNLRICDREKGDSVTAQSWNRSTLAN